MKTFTKLKLINFAFILLLSNSCNKNIEHTYYDDGNLHATIEKTENDSLFYCTEYYPNGNKKFEGICIDRIYPHGRVTEYYSDGQVKWTGEFLRGQRVVYKHIDSLKQWGTKPMDLYTTKDVRDIYEGEVISFRVTIKDVHPEFYAVVALDTSGVCHEIPYQEEDEECFPYTLQITPDIIHYEDNQPYLDISAFFINEEGSIIVPTNPHVRTFLWPKKYGPNRHFYN